MSILPAYLAEPAKPRLRVTLGRSLSPNPPPGFARSHSSSSLQTNGLSSATSPRSNSPPFEDANGESLFRKGTPFSPTTAESLDNPPMLVDLPPSPDLRAPKVIPYVPSKGTRRRSNTVETGGRGGWEGWKERRWKYLAKRGWTKNMIAWRLGALFLIGLFFLSGRIKKRWEDKEQQSYAAAVHRGNSAFPTLVEPLLGRMGATRPEPEEHLSHEFSADGFLRSSLDTTQRHPIWELMDHATEQYNVLVQNQALSLGNLVDHYKKANHRKPPVHFNLLYPHLLEARPYSPLPSPSPLHMYTSLTPHLLHGRQLASEAFYELNPDHEPPAADEDSGRFVLVIENGIARTEWPWNPTYAGMEVPGDDGGLKDRLNGWLLRPEWQGKVGDLRITVSMDAHNPQIIPHSYKQAAARRSFKNQFELDQGELRSAPHEWAMACDPTSPFVKKTAGGFGRRMRNRAGAFSPHFVHSPDAATDVCQHPGLKPLSDIMTSYDTPLEVDTRPIPQLALRAGLGSLGSDVISLGVGHASEQDGYPSNAVPWEQKTGLAAFWRGPAPAFHAPLTPHSAHRLSSVFRAALLPTTPIDSHSFPLTLLAPNNKLALAAGGSSAGRKNGHVVDGFGVDADERVSSDLWNKMGYLDIAFEGQDKLDCEGMNGCDYLTSRVQFDFAGAKDPAMQRYVLVFDGEDPSRAFESGSLVLHSSPLGVSAWQTKAIAWHDYIPVSPDFSDLPSLLLFLRANDDVAQRIAENGQAFGRKVLSKDAGVVSVLGQLLEWARVWSVSRGDMDYGA